MPRPLLIAIGGMIAVTVAAGGCESSIDNTPRAAADAGARGEVDGDTLPGPGATEKEPDPTGPGIRGTVVDEGGTTLAGFTVLLCAPTVCQYATSSPTGRFVFPEFLRDGKFLMKTVEDLAVVPARGSAILPVRPAGADSVDVGELFVPSMPTAAVLGAAANDPQTLKVGDGLELTLRRADLQPPLGSTDDAIAARALPQQRLAVLTKLGIRPVAAFALSPHGMESSTKIGVRLPTQLPAGTQAALHTVNDLDGVLSAPITVVSDGSVLATAPGDGITELTWLIVSN
jgi:hypothetical protein